MTYAVNLAAMLELTRRPADLPLLLVLREIVTEEIVNPIRGQEISTAAVLVRDDVAAER